MGEIPHPVDVLGVKIAPIDTYALLDILSGWASDSERQKAYYVNAHAINLAIDLPDFRRSLNTADLVICDGYGVVVASRLLGSALPDRLTGLDWIDQFLERLRDLGLSCFLLGDEPGVSQTCAARMELLHKGLAIAGTHHGFFDTTDAENATVIEAINNSGAEVLLVGMGMPRQEYWIDQNLGRLNVSLALPVGALFRGYSGVEKRAPGWLTDHGFEWLTRLLTHPLRHFRRYVIGLPRFLLRVLRERAKRRP